MRRDLLLRLRIQCLNVTIDRAALLVVEALLPLCLPHLDCSLMYFSSQVNVGEIHSPFFGWVILASRRDPPAELGSLAFFAVRCEDILKSIALGCLDNNSNLVAHCLFTGLIDACPTCLSI